MHYKTCVISDSTHEEISKILAPLPIKKKTLFEALQHVSYRFQKQQGFLAHWEPTVRMAQCPWLGLQTCSTHNSEKFVAEAWVAVGKSSAIGAPGRVFEGTIPGCSSFLPPPSSVYTTTTTTTAYYYHGVQKNSTSRFQAEKIVTREYSHFSGVMYDNP